MKNRLSESFSEVSKNWLKYFIYAMIIFIYIVFYTLVNRNSYIMAQETGNNTSFSVIQIIGNFIFGVLFGFEHIINENKKDGLWVFNVPRFVFLGIPSLLFSLYIFIYYSNIPVLMSITDHLPDFMLYSYFYVINQILFGYVLVSNFSKRK